jgi:hypothetical protein
MQGLATEPDATSEQLRRISASFGRLPARQSYRKVLRNEGFGIPRMIALLAEGRLDIAEYKPPEMQLSLPLDWNWLLRRMIRHHRMQVDAACRDTAVARKEAWKKVARYHEREKEEAQEVRECLESWQGKLALLFAPSRIHRHWETEMYYWALLRATDVIVGGPPGEGGGTHVHVANLVQWGDELGQLVQLCVALRLHRRQTGQFPDDLAQIKDVRAELTYDPFADAPVTYRKTDDGFVLYSYGTNMSDDGGHHPEDIVVRYPRAERGAAND